MGLAARNSATQTVAWLYLLPPLGAFCQWLTIGAEALLLNVLAFVLKARHLSGHWCAHRAG